MVERRLLGRPFGFPLSPFFHCAIASQTSYNPRTMNDAAKKYVGVLIDRICELNIENRILKQMLREPSALHSVQWEHLLGIVMRSPESDLMRKRFAERRDSVLATLEQDEAVEAMLKLPAHGLPN